MEEKEEMKEEKRDLPLATEIIWTLKKIIYFLILLEALTIGGFMWYLSLPVDEVSSSQNVSEIDASTINQVIGGNNNGESDTESDLQETGSEKSSR